VCGDETETVREVVRKCFGSFEMWCMRRLEKISWTDYVRNNKVLHRVEL
jgi:hypothetical protein